MSPSTFASVEQVLRDLIICLYGPGSKVSKATSPPSWSQSHVLADYVDDHGVACCRIVCDLQLANTCGAALSRIPSGIAEESTKAGTVPQNILDNLHEVLNICVTLFQNEDLPHVVLGDVQVSKTSPAPLPGVDGKKWSSWKIEIPSYPSGLIHLQFPSQVPARL